MKEMMRDFLVKFVLPVSASVVVGMGSAIVSCMVMNASMEGRLAHLEIQIEKHEKALDRDFSRHEQTVALRGHKTDDQEKRLTRLETLVGEIQALLNEIRTDVKILIRGGQQ